jgi:hypothetical protein
MPCSPWSMTRPQAGDQHPAVTSLTPEYLRHLLKAQTGRMGNRAEYCKPRPEGSDALRNLGFATFSGSGGTATRSRAAAWGGGIGLSTRTGRPRRACP